jgi:HEAT repeat protein
LIGDDFIMFDRDELIEKIIIEKGIEAIPNLIELIEDEDPEMRELASEVLTSFGPEAKDYVFEEFKKRFASNNEDDVVLLYLSEVLSDYQCKEILPYLERMLNMYNDERAFPLIIENLFKLSKDEKYLNILETFIEDEGELEEIGIMAITHAPSEKVVDILIKKYEASTNKSIKVFVLDSILKVLLSDLSLVPYLKEKNLEIAEKIQWQIENSQKI